MKVFRTIAAAFVLSCACAGSAFAQDPAPGGDPAPTVGRKGATQLTFNFFLTGTPLSSSSSSGATTTWSGNYFGGFGVGRFVTQRLVLQLGTIISGQLGGQSAGNLDGFGSTTGPTLIGSSGLLFYATPNRPGSLYFGADFQTQLSNRVEGQIGDLFARVGVETVIGNNASIFFEGGYGKSIASTSSTSDTGTPGSLTTQVGLRILFK